MTSSVEVRRATPLDGTCLQRVRLAALLDAPSAFGSTFAAEVNRPTDEWAQRAVAGSAGSDRATFFAQLGDEILGLVGGYRETPTSTTVELISMWVAPQARGQGVGALLVDAMIAWAVETNAEALALWVTRGNTPAERLYTTCGFTATGETQALPSDPAHAEVRMMRPLRLGEILGQVVTR